MPGSEPVPEPVLSTLAPEIAQTPPDGPLAGCSCYACQERRSAGPASPLNFGRIRGRYDFSSSWNRNDALQGAVRWREPGTMQVYDEFGLRQWTYTEELAGGVLRDPGNRRWYTTEV